MTLETKMRDVALQLRTRAGSHRVAMRNAESGAKSALDALGVGTADDDRDARRRASNHLDAAQRQDGRVEAYLEAAAMVERALDAAAGREES